MADMESELQAAFEAQQRRKVQLEQSVDELRQVAEQGKSAGAGATMILWVVGLLLFAALSAVLLLDKAGRVWFWPLLGSVVLLGAWSYYRKKG